MPATTEQEIRDNINVFRTAPNTNEVTFHFRDDTVAILNRRAKLAYLTVDQAKMLHEACKCFDEQTWSEVEFAAKASNAVLLKHGVKLAYSERVGRRWWVYGYLPSGDDVYRALTDALVLGYYRERREVRGQ